MKIEQARQISDIQSRIIQMKNMQPRNNNNLWPKRNLPVEQRPPNPLESANIVSHSFCRSCQKFHDEKSCAITKNILSNKFTTTVVQINMFGKEFHLPLKIGWRL